MSSPHIAIIGGGFTGLTAAYQLSKLGYRVTIFERGQTLGGLASGFTLHGQPLEKAYHHLFTTDRAIRDLIEELGLTDELLERSSSVAIAYEGTLYPFTTPFDLLRFKPLGIFATIRFAFVTLFLKYTKNYQQFIPINAATWLKKWYGTRAYRVVWEPLLKGKFHDHYQAVSMAWLWARIYVRANSSKGGQEKLLYPGKGFVSIVDALVQKLTTNNVRIVFDTKINSITTPSGVPTINFTDGMCASFDRILCTIPSHTFALLAQEELRQLPEYRAQLESMHYLGAVLTVFSSPQSLSKYYWHNINDLASPFLVFLQHTNLIEKELYGGNHVYYLGAYVPHEHRFFQMSEDEVRQEYCAYLKKLFPNFDQTLIREQHVFCFKNAQHVVDTEYSQKIPSFKTPLPGIYLANFSQIFPEDRGTNYAVRDGKTIAELIHQSLHTEHDTLAK